MAKKTNKPEEIPFAEYEEVEIWKETQKKVVDRVSEKPRKDTLEVLRTEVPAAPKLAKEDIARKDEFKWMIDLHDTNSLIEFWADAWTEVANIAESILADTKVRSLSVIWTELNELITTLETWDFYWDDKWLISKLKRWFKKKRNWMISVEDVIWKIEGIVDAHITSLEEYIPLLDDLLSANERRFNELKLYILAWKEKVEEMKKEFDEKYNEFLENDGVIDDFERQKLMEIETNITIFTQKIQDLESLSLMAITNAAQINAMKGSASMIEMKMKNAKVSIIPIFRMQWVISAVSSDIQSIVDASKSISDTTQRMLIRNADMTWALARWAATEFQRPVIETQTFEHVLKSISDTYKDVEKIAQDWEKKRLEWNVKIEKLLSWLSWNTLKQIEWPKKK